MDQDVADAITQAANEDGIDPTFALSVADRESGGNPSAPGTGTISGLFQMRGDLRQQYGAGNSTDPYTQAKAWDRFITDTGSQMAKGLGRQPTTDELYYGHYFGADRAVAMINGDGKTNVADVFTPNEMQKNPNFAQAGTTGALMSSISADLASRAQKFGSPNFAAFGTGQNGEEPAGQAPLTYKSTPASDYATDSLALTPQAIDFSQFGAEPQTEEQPQGSSQAASEQPEEEASGGSLTSLTSPTEGAEPEYGMSEGELQGLRQNPGYAQMQRAQARGGRGGQEVDMSLFQPGKNLQNAGLQAGAPQNPALGQGQQQGQQQQSA